MDTLKQWGSVVQKDCLVSRINLFKFHLWCSRNIRDALILYQVTTGFYRDVQNIVACHPPDTGYYSGRLIIKWTDVLPQGLVKYRSR